MCQIKRLWCPLSSGSSISITTESELLATDPLGQIHSFSQLAHGLHSLLSSDHSPTLCILFPRSSYSSWLFRLRFSASPDVPCPVDSSPELDSWCGSHVYIIYIIHKWGQEWKVGFFQVDLKNSYRIAKTQVNNHRVPWMIWIGNGNWGTSSLSAGADTMSSRLSIETECTQSQMSSPPRRNFSLVA